MATVNVPPTPRQALDALYKATGKLLLEREQHEGLTALYTIVRLAIEPPKEGQ